MSAEGWWAEFWAWLLKEPAAADSSGNEATVCCIRQPDDDTASR